MESSIEIIYNVIKTEYENNRNIKPIEEIITNEYINVLLDTYDNNKVIYCLKTLQNIGIDFEISVLPNYNSNEVLLRCVNEMKSLFNVDKWQINQPIIKSDINTALANVKGVQSVIGFTLNNLYDSDQGYSGNIYDLTTATKNGIIYPSLDPSIFEVKFPNRDIKGRVVK